LILFRLQIYFYFYDYLYRLTKFSISIIFNPIFRCLIRFFLTAKHAKSSSAEASEDKNAKGAKVILIFFFFANLAKTFAAFAVNGNALGSQNQIYV